MKKITTILELGIGTKIKYKVNFRRYITYTITNYRDTPQGSTIYLEIELIDGVYTGTNGWKFIDNLIKSGRYYTL